MLGCVILNKKERGVTITVGLTIGIILSFGLVSRWKEDRDAYQKKLPGNYDSNQTAYGKTLSEPPPESIQEEYPGGRVLYHVNEANASVTLPGKASPKNIWILTTNNGSYKFVRVEQAAADGNATDTLSLYRGAEIFVWTSPGTSEDELRDALPEDRYNLLGKNELRGCYLVQFREVSPEGLPEALGELLAKPMIDKVEPCLIE
ncbi:MAG: hypothetical protein CMI31_08805 [Opitutae bacterium]|nr:hypothetical protein [Opitutae bacterium]|tara:strand:- start:226 stop:837 length:612 start_codon:yes stop_codon:yes gene_type:complete